MIATVTRPDRRTADLLLDRDRLSEIVGRPVRATRLRHKPGLSTLAALTSDGNPVGWVQVATDQHEDKIAKSVRRATRADREVQVRRPGDGLTVAWGDLDTDAELRRALSELALPSVTAAVATGDLGLLRYNPHRRLVLHCPHRDGGIVLRATADPQVEAGRLPTLLSRHGVPVLHPLPVNDARREVRVTAWPWFGQGTLADAPDRVARAAGEMLSRLHRIEPSTSTLIGEAHRVTGLCERALAVADDLACLDPDLGARVRPLAADLAARLRARPWATGPVHGDFSADQVLVALGGDVRLIDFDRYGWGPRWADLGSFAAVELLTLDGDPAGTDPARPARTRALLDGYHAPLIDEDALRLWTARALLARVDEPFRAGHPDWAYRIADRLEQLRAVLGTHR